jgi:hypothetical protein
MFGRSKKEHSSISEYFLKKSRLLMKKKSIFRSRIEYAIRGEHQHYFNKQEVLTLNQNARCKICGMLLSEFRLKQKMDNWSPHLKPVYKNPQK